jgi:hypothetical protein
VRGRCCWRRRCLILRYIPQRSHIAATPTCRASPQRRERTIDARPERCFRLKTNLAAQERVATRMLHAGRYGGVRHDVSPRARAHSATRATVAARRTGVSRTCWCASGARELEPAQGMGGQAAWESWQRVRASTPLVQCLTNLVSMDLMANTLLCSGASPAMVRP